MSVGPMPAHSTINPTNIVQRLQQRIGEAKQLGFTVRTECLSEQKASWCVVKGKSMIFLDLASPAHEQLRQLNEVLESCESHKAGYRVPTGNGVFTGKQAA